MGWELIVVIAVSTVALTARRQLRARTKHVLARETGLRYARRGLRGLAPELADTVLMRAGDGGHEDHVLQGSPQLEDESVPVSMFDFRFQRAVRGETAVMMTRPPFRIDGPTVVIAYQLHRRFGRMLIKRRGRGDDLAAALRPPGDFAGVAREASGIERVISVPAPSGLDGDPQPAPQLDGWRVWTANAEQVAAVLSPEVCALLSSPASGSREWVVELLGPLLLVYCAQNGKLDAAESYSMKTFTDELCRRIARATRPLSPRGMEHRA